jgi:hypothetical protein
MVIFSRLLLFFLDDKEAYSMEARSCATIMECRAYGVSQRWSACWLFPEDYEDTTMIIGLWQALTFRRNPEAGSWEHVSLIHTGGHLREVYD